MSATPRAKLSILAAAAAAVLLLAPPAWAGCGCDHPPPAFALVMPPFASPGTMLSLAADGFTFEVGSDYVVDFAGQKQEVVTATEVDRLEVKFPKSVSPGPVEISLLGPGVNHLYDDSLFTALPKARRIKDRTGIFAARDYDAAIGADGTLYLALDVSKVLDATQFTFALHGLPLHFEHDDVVIYNADGVDLTLFTLHVEDTVERQWGSYYGWSVESDTGLTGTWYAPKSAAVGDLYDVSSLFTYWRHEFHTYAAAHEPGGSHEVDTDGLHPDGTLHIDHDSLIIAIRGVERSMSDPSDLTLATPLDGGSRTLDVGWLSIETAQPLELPAVSPLVEDPVSVIAEELEEVEVP